MSVQSPTHSRSAGLDRFIWARYAAVCPCFSLSPVRFTDIVNIPLPLLPEIFVAAQFSGQQVKGTTLSPEPRRRSIAVAM